MESKNLIYKYGHFYDIESRRRIGLTEASEICIVAASNCFTIPPKAGTFPLKILAKDEKELAILDESELLKHKKIYESGTFLYFSIPHTLDKNNAWHEFKVELMEDLYLYQKKTWKQQEQKLYNCACIVRENISGTIDYFEEIYAESLNEAYKCTFVHFFGNDGNPACNAIDRFYDKPGMTDRTLRRFRE